MVVKQDSTILFQTARFYFVIKLCRSIMMTVVLHYEVTSTSNPILGPSFYVSFGPRQANLVLIAYASNEGSGEPAHPRSLARTSAARSYKQ